MPEYRFSDDLDFTLIETYTETQIQAKITQSIQEAKTKTGIDYQDTISFKKVTNGYRATIGFRLLRTSGSPIKIIIDLTTPENEKILLPPVKHPINHPYSDKLKAEIQCYQLKEILAEKIRSLFQRTRPRDLYDVWTLSNQKQDISVILEKKFKSKNTEFDITNLINRQEDFVNSWDNSLRHQISDLPECLPVFNTVIKYLHSFEEVFQ